MIYAIIRKDGTIKGISHLSGVVDSPDMIPIDTYDVSIIGKSYKDGNFIDTEVDLENVKVKESTPLEVINEKLDQIILMLKKN